MPKMIDPSTLERPIEKGDEWGAVDAFLAQLERGMPLESLYLTAEHLALRRYDFETPAPNLPHGMIAINSAWGLLPYLGEAEPLVVFGLAQGFAMLAMENRQFERARTVARRPVRGLAIGDLASLVVEKVEKGDIAEADGALSTLIERSEGDRALVARAFFTSAAQDLQNWGHKGTFASHLWQIAERDAFSELFAVLRPGIHYFAAFGSRDEKRQIERHAAELDPKTVQAGRRKQDDQPAVEGLANRMLSGGSTKAVVEALQGGFAVEDVVDAAIVAACEDLRNSTNIPMTIEALAYVHATRTAVRAGGPTTLLPLFQAAAWVHECAVTRELAPLKPAPEIDPRQAASNALLEDFMASQGHLVKITETILAERAEAPAWMVPHLDTAQRQATRVAPSSRTLLDRYKDRLKIPDDLRGIKLVA